MTQQEALEIAEHYCLQEEVQYFINNGCTPEEALQEWDLPTDYTDFTSDQYESWLMSGGQIY